MNIDRIPDVRPDTAETPVTVKRCGNVIEVRYMRSTPCAVIEKVNADLYVDKRTGEVKEFCHSANRADSKASVAQSLRKLRDLINANLTAPETALWVTLTYKENMRDERRVYEDFRRFWQRFRYYLKKHEYRPAEYITAAEPQGRGAWHLHCLFLFPEKAPFIPNADMARIWGHGFTKTKSLQGIDNPGLYLTAYLGDMELSEALRVGNAKGQIAEAEITDAQGKRRKKAIIKGARLHLYPAAVFGAKPLYPPAAPRTEAPLAPVRTEPLDPDQLLLDYARLAVTEENVALLARQALVARGQVNASTLVEEYPNDFTGIIGLHTYSQSPHREYDITLTGNWVERGGFRFQDFVLTRRKEVNTDGNH